MGTGFPWGQMPAATTQFVAAAYLWGEADGGRLVPGLQAAGDRRGRLRRQPRFLLQQLIPSIHVHAFLPCTGCTFAIDEGGPVKTAAGLMAARRRHSRTGLRLTSRMMPSSGRRDYAAS